MQYMEFILLGVFIVASIIGYFLIKNVPSLLHTPLMSGMNALSGITILGVIVVSVKSKSQLNPVYFDIILILAFIVAFVNIVGGFLITDRMLRMISHKKKGEKND